MIGFKKYLEESESVFHSILMKHYPNGVDIYHESPGHDVIPRHWIQSIKEVG